MTAKTWDFVHNLAKDAKWTPGLREIFEYRDLGIKDGTHGDFIAHLIRHNGKRPRTRCSSGTSTTAPSSSSMS
jgi:hypothetical protein